MEQFLKNNCVLLEVFEHLYFQVFKLFNDTWVDQRPGIMNFTQFLQNVFTDVFTPKAHHFLKEFIFQMQQQIKKGDRDVEEEVRNTMNNLREEMTQEELYRLRD